MAKGAAVDFDANTAKARGELAKVYKELAKSKEQAKAMGREVAAMGKKLESAGIKGQRGLSGLGSQAGQLVGKLRTMIGAGGAIALFAQGLASIREGAMAAAAGVRELEAARRSLGQIARSKEHYAVLRAEAQKLALAEGISEAAAIPIVHKAESAGILPAAGEMTRAATGLDIDPVALMDAVVTMKEAFGEAAGKPMDIANKLLAAAKETKLNVTEVARVAAIPAAAAIRVGAGLEEVLTLVAGATGPTAKPAIAAQRVKAAAEEVARAGFEGPAGIGIMAGIEQWRAGAPEEYEKKRMARAEFGEAITLFKMAEDKIDRIGRLVAQATTGVTPIERGLAIVESDPEVREAREARRQQVAADIEYRQLMGGKALDLETARKAAVAAEAAYRETLPEWQQPIAAFLGVINRMGSRVGEVLAGPEFVAAKEAEYARGLRLRMGQGEKSDADRMLDAVERGNELREQGNADRKNMMGPPELSPAAVGNQ